MPADNRQHLQDAARRRSEQSHRMVRDTLKRFEAHGGPVTVTGIAAAAGVSRTFLYSQPGLLEAVGALRAAGRHEAVPRRQRATEASLLQRIDALTAKNKQLRSDNATLRRELAAAHGQLRDERQPAVPRR